MDAKSPLELLQEIKDQYGEWIDQETLEKIILANLNVLDSWAVDQLNKTLEAQRDALRAKGIPEDQIDKRVPLIPKTDGARTQNISVASKRSQLLQNKAYAEHFNKVEDIVTEGILSGKSKEEITESILKATDMDAARARFWAEDQAAIFKAEQTRIAAIREGYTHYRWVAGDSARPSHLVHRGKICSWNVGVNNLTRPGARHPGEDYRCHCDAELLNAEQVQKLGGVNEPPRDPQLLEGLIENYYGSEEAKAIKGSQNLAFLTDTLLGTLSQPYKVSAMSATSEMNKEIDMEKIYATYPIQFQPFPEDSSFSSQASGAYANSNIFINEKSSNAILTVVHETAHHLEERVLAKGFTFLDTMEGKVFMGKIKEMDSFQKLLASRNMPKEFLEYYTKDKEVFSRIMEQYFAKKRGGEIARQFREKRLFLQDEYSVDCYFQDSDFQVIEKMVDSIFEKRGLKR